MPLQGFSRLGCGTISEQRQQIFSKAFGENRYSFLERA
jgi:hypothetical protein